MLSYWRVRRSPRILLRVVRASARTRNTAATRSVKLSGEAPDGGAGHLIKMKAGPAGPVLRQSRIQRDLRLAQSLRATT